MRRTNPFHTLTQIASKQGTLSSTYYLYDNITDHIMDKCAKFHVMGLLGRE